MTRHGPGQGTVTFSMSQSAMFALGQVSDRARNARNFIWQQIESPTLIKGRSGMTDMETKPSGIWYKHGTNHLREAPAPGYLLLNKVIPMWFQFA